MIKKVVICDICGQQFSPYENSRVNLKIRNENYCNYDDFEYRKWKKYDLCPICTLRLINTIKRGEVDDN